MQSHFQQAVEIWQRGEKSRREFAFHAAQVDGRETAALAERCGRISVATVEDYRRAYRLYRLLETQIEEDGVGTLWRRLNISVWIALARAAGRYELAAEKSYDYIQRADGLTVDAFRALLANDLDERPEWARALQQVARRLGRIGTAYIPDMPPEKQCFFQSAASEFEGAIMTLVAEWAYICRDCKRKYPENDERKLCECGGVVDLCPPEPVEAAAVELAGELYSNWVNT